MTLLSILILALTLSAMMPLFQQPIPSGMTLLLLALISTTFLGFVVSPWYGYLLFLVYVSGMLVVFGYVCAMTPNTLFLIVPKLPLVITLMILTFVVSFTSGSLFQGDMTHWELGAYSILSEENLGVYWLVAVLLLAMLVITVYMLFKKASPLRGFDAS